jgi:hypothetical protein
MRRIILIFGVLMINGFNAQVKKNTFNLGVYLNSTESFHLGSKNTFSAEYMLSEKWGIATEFGFKSAGVYSSNNSYFMTNTTLSTRYYFMNEKNALIYGNAGFVLNKSVFNGIDYKIRQSIYSAKVGIGATYFLSRKFALDIQSNLMYNPISPRLMIEGKIGLQYYFRTSDKK